MEPSSSDPATTALLAPSSPGTDAPQDKSNGSDLIQIDREEGATGGEDRLSEEEESGHRICEGDAVKNEEEDLIKQNLGEHHHAEKTTHPADSSSASTAPTPLVEVDWDLLTTGESAPLVASTSSSTHPVDVRSHNKGKEKEYQMDGHGGEVLVASPRPASPPLDVVAPAFRVRLDSRELASSDIVVEETSSPSTLSSMALLEEKRKQQRHTATHLPRQGALSSSSVLSLFYFSLFFKTFSFLFF